MRKRGRPGRVRINVNFQIDGEMKRALDLMALEEERSLSGLIRIALRRMLEEYAATRAAAGDGDTTAP